VLYKPKKVLSEYGQCNEETNELWIYARLGPAKEMQTFIHEALHAIDFTMGILEPDEKETEARAQLMYQALITAQYE